MTKNDTINAALLGLIGVFGGGAVTLFATNFWYSIVCAAAVVVCSIAYTLLPE